MRRIRFIRIITLICLAVSGTLSLQAEPTAEAGKTIFKQNCSSCHAMDKKLVGPKLDGVEEKYKGQEEWLYKWIRNSPALIASGDAQAVALWEANGKAAMTAFPNLTDDELASLMVYFAEWDKATSVPGPPTPPVPTADPGIYYGLLALVGILVLVALLLTIITATLVTAIRAKEQQETIKFADVMARTRSILQNKFVITAIMTFVIVGGLAKWIAEARTIGLHQGYMPEQPIAFSHKLHAGEYQIDCKYCHSGTTKSKSAWIPSTNVCMNCHKVIQQKEYPGDAARTAKSKSEIAKIYASVGWDPETATYTGTEKAVEWIRIHNTPDHAYFNHAQHVVVGNIACQTCHGPIQEMEVVYQYSDLGMGWCINCHRQEKVKVLGKDNEEGLTVEDMGGLNCSRCHY
ncbi:MAG: c-type cytochrome [Bacteroidia bacterium]|nr:c-type cytochrome [Bacteroidia bacterium]